MTPNPVTPENENLSQSWGLINIENELWRWFARFEVDRLSDSAANVLVHREAN